MLLVFGFIVGTILGSFVKALVDRTVSEVSLGGRSYCPGCKTTIRWYDLFPVVSFLLLGGRCRHCHKKIPGGIFLTEVVLGILSATVFWSVLPADFISSLATINWQTVLILLELIFKLFVVVILAALLLIDFKTGLLPNKITYPAAAIALVYLSGITALKSWIFYQQLIGNPFGKYLLKTSYLLDNLQRIWLTAGGHLAAAGLVSLFFVLLIVVTRGRGMGWGDVKYVLFLGLALGFPNIIVAIFLAFLLGSIMALALIFLKRKKFGQTIPFGPFLSLGAFIALLWGDFLVNWYIRNF